MAADACRALGQHILVDLKGCEPALINDAAHVEKIMLDAARAARSTIIQSVFHSFSPQGVSGVVVIAESHLAIHTWPEHGLASVDIYTSGAQAQPRLAVPVLERGFAAKKLESREFSRAVIGT